MNIGKQQNSVDAVLFDLGDTLVHFATVRPREIIDRVCRPGYERLVSLGHGLPSYERYVRNLKWRFLRSWLWSRVSRREARLTACLAGLHGRLGLDLDDDGLTRTMCVSVVPTMHSITSVDEGARPMLDALRDAGVQMGLVSNTHFPGYAIDQYLEEAGLLEYFPVRAYSSEHGFMKPHPRIFEAALEEMRIDSSRALYVGDRTDKDVVGAARVGMRSILFAHERSRVQRRVRPDYVVNELMEIPALVMELRR